MEPPRARERRTTALIALFLAGFWGTQAVVAVVFKYGALERGYWLACYVAGNVIGVGSAVLWMAALKRGKGNIVTGLAVGGTFLAQQIALVLVYRGSLTPVQDVGIAAIVGGMLCLGFGAREKKPLPHAERGIAARADAAEIVERAERSESYLPPR